MKFCVYVSAIAVLQLGILLTCIVSGDAAAISIRMPRSVTGILKKLLGRRKEQGYAQYQGPSYASSPYASGQYGAASYQYPSYAAYPSQSSAGSGAYGTSGTYGSSPSSYPTYGGSSYSQSPYSSQYGSQYYSQSGQQQPSASYSYPSYSQAPQQGASGQPQAAASSYQGTYQYPPSAYQSSASSGSGGNLDLHQVLDALVRSAGLAPVGDQEAAASSISAARGDTPVFSFKKLYSFPFYLSSDDKAKDSYQLHIPFMKKHIRRRMGDKPQQ